MQNIDNRPVETLLAPDSRSIPATGDLPLAPAKSC